MIKSISQLRAHLYVVCTFVTPDVSWAHQPINNSPLCCQSKSTWASLTLAVWPTSWLFWCSSVAQPSSTWASMWLAFTTSFSTQAAISCQNWAAQMGLLLYCQFFCFQCYCIFIKIKLSWACGVVSELPVSDCTLEKATAVHSGNLAFGQLLISSPDTDLGNRELSSTDCEENGCVLLLYFWNFIC